MKLEEIRGIAKSHHINPGKLSKTELVKSIQSGEGNPMKMDNPMCKQPRLTIDTSCLVWMG